MGRADLRRALHVHARSVDNQGHTLAEFMREHATELADAFGTSPDVFANVGDVPDAELGPRTLALIERERVERLERLRREQRDRSLDAAGRLAVGAQWSGDRAILLVPLLFGPLLADKSIAFVVFVFPNDVEVFIERAKLADVARAVATFEVLNAWVEVRGLFISWMRGRGRIHLYPQAVTAMPSDRLLRVVLPAAAPTPASQRTPWFRRWGRDVLEEVIP